MSAIILALLILRAVNDMRHADRSHSATLQLSAFDLESLHGKGDAPVPKRLLNECK